MNKKSSQIRIGVILLILAAGFGAWLISQGSDLVWYWVLGLAFGYVMQRSSICFTASARDPFISGSTSQFRAILMGILAASLGITAIKYLSSGTLDLLGVSAISIPLMLGAFMFGVGMVISGCCASGMFIRLAEGHTVQIITLICVIIGYVFANSHREKIWNLYLVDAPIVFLPQKCGWFFGVFINIAIVLLLYAAAIKWEAKKSI